MPRFFHHSLLVYQKILQFILHVDPVIGGWPRERSYLVYQFRKACSSIGLNTAEAAYEISAEDKRRLFRYARRSAGECVGVLDQALLFGLMTESEAAPFYDELK